MSAPQFINVGGTFVALAHIIAWKYTPEQPGGEYDEETGGTIPRRRSKIEITTAALATEIVCDYGDHTAGVASESVVVTARGTEADALRDHLNAMVTP